MAYSLYVDIASHLKDEVRLRVLSDDTVTVFRLKTIKQVDRLANKIDEGRVVENEAELAYKREYQRRITQVYRTDKENKQASREEFMIWKIKAREELKKYRENKISSYDFCDWIEKHK